MRAKVKVLSRGTGFIVALSVGVSALIRVKLICEGGVRLIDRTGIGSCRQTLTRMGGATKVRIRTDDKGSTVPYTLFIHGIVPALKA